MLATIPKGIVGGFEFTVFQRNLKEMMAQEAIDSIMFPIAKGKQQIDSSSVRNSVLIISHITSRDCRVYIFSTTFLEIAVPIALF